MGYYEIRNLRPEAWSLYGFSMTIIVLRLWGQIRRNGITKLFFDDWIMVLAAVFYTLFIYWTIATAEAFAISDNSINTLEDLTDTGPKEYIKGSKYVLIAEEGMTNTLYLLKASLLCLYTRLTFGRRTERLVLALSVYVGLAWASTQICFFTLTCKPFSGNWAVPPPNDQCISWKHYATCQGVFNISTDAFMLMVPLPLFLRSQFSWKKKVFLCIVFGLGSVVIAFAIINKLNLSGSSWMFWNVRESSVAVCTANAPAVVSFIRSFFTPTIKRETGQIETAGSGEPFIMPISEENPKEMAQTSDMREGSLGCIQVPSALNDGEQQRGVTES